MKIKEAQQMVKEFSLGQGWEDSPCIDKFDHIHEELTEISHLLRYKDLPERLQAITENKDKIQNEMGDVIFGILRLCNQLQIDAETGFRLTADKVKSKFNNVSENRSSDLQREKR